MPPVGQELTTTVVQQWLQDSQSIYDEPDQTVELILRDMVKTRFIPESRYTVDPLEAFQDYVRYADGQPNYVLRRSLKTVADHRRNNNSIKRFLEGRGIRNVSDLHLRLVLADMRRNNEPTTVDEVAAKYAKGRSPMDAKTKIERRAVEVRRRMEQTIRREAKRQGFERLLERQNENGDKMVDLQEFLNLPIFIQEGFDREVLRDVFNTYSSGDSEITAQDFQVETAVNKIKNSLAQPDVSTTDVRLVLEAMKQSGIRVRKFPQFVQFTEREGAVDRLAAIRSIVRRVRRKMEYEIMKQVQSAEFDAAITRCDRDGNRRVSESEFTALLSSYDPEVVKDFFRRYANESNEISPEEFRYLKRPFQEEYVVRRKYLYNYIFEEGKMRFTDDASEEGQEFPVFEEEDEALSVEPGYKLREIRDARHVKGMEKPSFEAVQLSLGPENNQNVLRRILQCQGRERTTLPRRHKDFVKITIVKYMEDVRFDRGIDWVLEDLFREYDEDNCNELSSREMNQVLRKIDPSHKDVDEGVFDLDQFKEFFRRSENEKYLDRLRTESITLRQHDFENRPWHTWNAKQLTHWVRSQGYTEMAKAFQAARLEGSDLIGFSSEDLEKLGNTVRVKSKNNFLMGAIEDLRQYRQYRIKRELRVRTRCRGLYTRTTLPAGTIVTVTDPDNVLSAAHPNEFQEEDSTEDILIVKRGSGWSRTDQIFMAVTTVQDIQESCLPCPRRFSSSLLAFLFSEYAPHTVEDRPEEMQRRCLEVAQSLGIATKDDIYFTVFDDKDKWTTEADFKVSLENARTRCIIERTLGMGQVEAFLENVRPNAPYNNLTKTKDWTAAEVAGFLSKWVPPDQEFEVRGPVRKKKLRMFGKKKIDQFDFDELPPWKNYAERICADVLAQNIDGQTLCCWGDKGVVDTLLWDMPPVYKYSLLEELKQRTAPGVNVIGIIVTLLAIVLTVLLWTRQTETGLQFWNGLSDMMSMSDREMLNKLALRQGYELRSPQDLAMEAERQDLRVVQESANARRRALEGMCSPENIPKLCFATKQCDTFEGDVGICKLISACDLVNQCGDGHFDAILESFVNNYRGDVCNAPNREDLCQLRDICAKSTAKACRVVEQCDLSGLQCPTRASLEGFREDVCRYAGSRQPGDPCFLMRGETCGRSREGACKLIDTCNLTHKKCAPAERRVKVTIKTSGECPGHDISNEITLEVLVNDPHSYTSEEITQLIKRQLRRKLSAKFGNQCEFNIVDTRKVS